MNDHTNFEIFRFKNFSAKVSFFKCLWKTGFCTAKKSPWMKLLLVSVIVMDLKDAPYNKKYWDLMFAVVKAKCMKFILNNIACDLTTNPL